MHLAARFSGGLWLMAAGLLATYTKTVPANAAPQSLAQSTEQSILMLRLADGKVVQAKNPDLPLNPASVTKLVTSAALLHYFGPHAQLQTSFYRTGPIRNGVVYGDLVIVGGGDPFFTSESMWQVAADLFNAGISEFKGDLLIDNSLFQESFANDDRELGMQQTSNAYQAPISAFGINFNTLALSVSPAEKVGMPPQVRFDPYPVAGLVLRNEANTSAAGNESIQVLRKMHNNQQTLVVTGKIPLGSEPLKVHRSLADTVQTVGKIVRSFLERNGVRVHGATKAGKAAANKELLLTYEGKTISEMIKGLHLYSNNYIADMLLARLAAAHATTGKEIIQRFLTSEVGVKGEFTVVDGSGLNPINRLSATQVVQVLRYVQKNPRYSYEYIGSLPSAGETGSLKRRFTDKEMQPLQGMVRAKTGTLSQPVLVSSLAGYFTHPQYGLCAFAILQNGKTPAAQLSLHTLHESQEHLLEQVLQNRDVKL
jgi:D-alanyl-D-alanine carboxypeptidase/D-alanyl-D-alanine-endopeptidase (penicillin-binding protein 4)